GGVDGIEAGLGKPVEQVEGGLLVRGPTEDVAPQDQRRDGKVGATETAFLQDCSPMLGWASTPREWIADKLGRALPRSQACLCFLIGPEQFHKRAQRLRVRDCADEQRG